MQIQNFSMLKKAFSSSSVALIVRTSNCHESTCMEIKRVFLAWNNWVQQDNIFKACRSKLSD